MADGGARALIGGGSRARASGGAGQFPVNSASWRAAGAKPRARPSGRTGARVLASADTYRRVQAAGAFAWDAARAQLSGGRSLIARRLAGLMAADGRRLMRPQLARHASLIRGPIDK